MTTPAQLTASLSGRYIIEREIGAGGMATVFLARDVKHNRRVALKVLNPELGAVLGTERFLSEIEVTANLQHPNLLPLFDSGAADGLLFYVMPFVDGESLRARLDRERQLSVDEAIHIATALASALAYAHERGVIHRDLKPENILLQAGEPLVADFGIALAVSKAGGARVTHTGISLGTPLYMSPEQATGDRAIDRRTDIYSLGVVLYEMLIGDPPFLGGTAQAIIAKVLSERPQDVRAVRPLIPVHVEATIARALEKLPADRFATAHDFAEALQGRTIVRPLAGHHATSNRGQPRVWVRRIAAAGAIIAAGMLVAAGWAMGRGERGGVAATPPAHLLVQLPPGVILPMDTRHPVLALSPDGTHLVFVGDDRGVRRLYRRDLADSVARPIPGTEGASHPFFLLDGTSVGFFAGSMIKRVALSGGVPVAIHASTPTTVNFGAAWLSADSIIYAASPNSGMSVASVAGDHAGPMGSWSYVTAERDAPYAWPEALPDGVNVLFTDNSADTASQARVGVFDRRDRSVRTLVLGGSNPHYSRTGHVLFVRGAALFAVPFEARSVRAAGSETKLLDGVMTEVTGAGHFAISATGTLAFVAGASAPQSHEIVWVDRAGNAIVILNDGSEYSFPRLSPDGKRLAITGARATNTDIWSLHLTRKTLERVTTGTGEDFGPVWSPDGTRLAISTEVKEDEGPGLSFVVGPEHRLEHTLLTPGIGNWEMPSSWSPDGKWVAFTREYNGKAADVELMPTSPPYEPIPFAATAADEAGAAFSPDGRAVAFVSDETGRPEIYVQPFPAPGARIQVSSSGGTEPLWSRDGKELFYREGTAMKAVRFSGPRSLESSAPTTLFEGRYEPVPYGSRAANYDVAADGRFVMIRRTNVPQPATIHIVLNWPAVLLPRSARER